MPDDVRPGAGERDGLSRALKGRTAYLAVLLFVALIVVANVVAALWERPGTGWGRHSLGTGRSGHKAFYELLKAAGFRLRRNHDVPDRYAAGDAAFFLIGPQGLLLRRDPRYLDDLAQWAAEGHTLVVAFGGGAPLTARILIEEEEQEEGEEDDEEGEEQEREQDRRRRPTMPWIGDDGEEAVFSALALDLERRRRSTEAADAELPAQAGDGAGNALLAGCRSLKLERAAYFSGPAVERATSSVRLDERPFLLEFRRGRGRVVLLAEASFLDNERILEADNGVFAFNVAWRYGREGVVFDEYYHGMQRTPNVVRLLCTFPLSVVTASLLLCVGVFVLGRWRHFGPPVPYEMGDRRSKAEHIQAMGGLYRRCRKARLALRQAMAGLARELTDAHGLPETSAPDVVIQRLRARSPAAADQLDAAWGRARAALRSRRRLSERRMLVLYADLWTSARKAIDAAR